MGDVAAKEMNWNIYKAFASAAVLGYQVTADEFLRHFEKDIEECARQLKKIIGFQKHTLYRGVLLQPEDAKKGNIASFQAAEYFSFSENVATACWFAHTETVISEDAVQKKPGVEGYIAECWPETNDILFHWKWAEHLNSFEPTMYDIIENLAKASQLLGRKAKDPKEAIMELYCNLRTQQEVILKAIRSFPIKPLAEYCKWSAQELDNRFLPRPDFVTAPPGLEKIGISADQKLYIRSAEFPKTHTRCPVCKEAGIDIIYHLTDVGLGVMNCTKCGQKTFYYED